MIIYIYAIIYSEFSQTLVRFIHAFVSVVYLQSGPKTKPLPNDQ